MVEDIDDEFAALLEKLIRRMVAQDCAAAPEEHLTQWLECVRALPPLDPRRVAVEQEPLIAASGVLSARRRAAWEKTLSYLDHLDACLRSKVEVREVSNAVQRDWATGAASRYRRGKMHIAEQLLLARRPNWSFEQPPTPVDIRLERSDQLWGRFAARLQAVRTYADGEGLPRIPVELKVEGVTLARWWGSVTANYHLGGLPARQARALDDSGLDLRPPRRSIDSQKGEPQ